MLSDALSANSNWAVALDRAIYTADLSYHDRIAADGAVWALQTRWLETHGTDYKAMITAERPAWALDTAQQRETSRVLYRDQVARDGPAWALDTRCQYST